MAYIPESHKKYNLLPMCTKYGGEVFVYDGFLAYDLEEYLPKGEGIFPFGYASYAEYFDHLNRIGKYFKTSEAKEIFDEHREFILKFNRKKEWSILKYIAEDTSIIGLTCGRNYYWPTSESEPECHGVVDNEEITSYWHSLKRTDWIILEDPTGMAQRVLDMD